MNKVKSKGAYAKNQAKRLDLGYAIQTKKPVHCQKDL